MNKYWFTLWKETKKQLLRENEDNFRKNSFISKEQQESVPNVSEAIVKSGH